MRHYFPFSHSAPAEPAPATAPAAAASPASAPASRGHLPVSSALPCVRKYLFAASPPTCAPAAPVASCDAADEEAALRAVRALHALRALVCAAYGPPRAPSASLQAHLPDALAATLAAPDDARDRLLAQFLRARSHDPARAFAMLQSALHWRAATGMARYSRQAEGYMRRAAACFPMCVLSKPRVCKQPVVYGLVRLLDKRAVEKGPFHDALLAFLETVYFGDSYVMDEMVIILDFRDWSIRRNAPYRLVKDAIQTLQDYYPERLGRVFLVNYPTSIRAAYTAISPIVDAGAKEKIVWVADADPAATLRNYVAPKSIPTFMGGELEPEFPPAWPDVACQYTAAS